MVALSIDGGGPVGTRALVLSGGRAAFQAGALVELLKYFEESGKRITILSGTSVGTLNGMAIPQAASLEEARRELENNWKSVTNSDINFLRDMEVVEDVNNDIRQYDQLKARILEAALTA